MASAATVRSIASACEKIDPEWVKFLEGPQKEEDVIRDCAARLNKLAESHL